MRDSPIPCITVMVVLLRSLSASTVGALSSTVAVVCRASSRLFSYHCQNLSDSDFELRDDFSFASHDDFAQPCCDYFCCMGHVLPAPLRRQSVQ